MAPTFLNGATSSPPLDLNGLDADVVELSVLVPGWQFAALEKAARGEGQTAAQKIRQLLRQFVIQSC